MPKFKNVLLAAISLLLLSNVLLFAQRNTAQAQNPGISPTALLAQVNTLKVQVIGLQADNDMLKAKTAPITVSGTDLTISGINVHIVSGSGRTSDGTTDRSGNTVPSKSLTGLGNLIIGYNSVGGFNGDVRTGSHNLVLGDANSYSSFGGLVAGTDNTISGRYASISGGDRSTAGGNYASVGGGHSNNAGGDTASVSGGLDNNASGDTASVSGGFGNKADGTQASVSGGFGNKATGDHASVSGGNGNTASGTFSSVSGGNRRIVLKRSGWVGGNQASDGFKSGNSRSP